MSKLTLDALKGRANEIASEELLGQISGGTANDCHPCEDCTKDNVTSQNTHSEALKALKHIIFH